MLEEKRRKRFGKSREGPETLGTAPESQETLYAPSGATRACRSPGNVWRRPSEPITRSSAGGTSRERERKARRTS